MSDQVKGVGIVAVPNSAGQRAGLLFSPRVGKDMGLSLERSILVTPDDSDATIGALVRSFFAEPAQEG